MAGRPEDFRKDINRFNKKVERVLVAVIVESVKVVRLKVALRTPILTGRASASWNASVNIPNFIPKPEGYFNPGGAPFDGSVNLSGIRIGSVGHVSNGVHYIGKLNRGSSRKAPAGFVEATVADFELALPRIISTVRRKVRI